MGEFDAVLGTSNDCDPGQYAASKALAHGREDGEFWSSTDLIGTFDNAWVARFFGGGTRLGHLSGNHDVRLVRAGQVLGGKPALEFVKVGEEKLARKQQAAKQAANQRAAEEARQRKEAQDREIRVAAFRKSIKEGDDTSVGVVIEVKGNLIKIQTNDSQCSQRDYDNNCKNWINTPVEKWFKRSEVYPQ